MSNRLSFFRRRCLAITLLLCCGFMPGAAPGWAAQSAKPASAAGKQTATSAKSSAAPMADADKLDLNTATADQLKALPGIGDAYTKRIIDGRPYTAKNQLTTRGILPQKAYDGIKDAVVARRPAKK